MENIPQNNPQAIPQTSGTTPNYPIVNTGVTAQRTPPPESASTKKQKKDDNVQTWWVIVSLIIVGVFVSWFGSSCYV